jgi:hypothetical protein
MSKEDGERWRKTVVEALFGVFGDPATDEQERFHLCERLSPHVNMRRPK